jgi:hypothetical protein
MERVRGRGDDRETAATAIDQAHATNAEMVETTRMAHADDLRRHQGLADARLNLRRL